jgi:RND superfamily putative drug exporter
MMLFAIVFGLSMDYEVFLLSRVREGWHRTGDSHTSVANGLAATARVITAAAAIMVVVFGAFMLESDRVIKLFGLGLSVAILLDATIVRMLLVPATMELLGDKNWWLPRWLDRLLPNIDVEGHGDPLEADEEGEPERELVTV